jgi:hypothetical protein
MHQSTQLNTIVLNPEKLSLRIEFLAIIATTNTKHLHQQRQVLLIITQK